jgi:hypothetical protein
MKRMVVDKNMLEDPKNLGPNHPLRAWLAASKDHIAVVTDYAQLEMLKGNALKNILKSTEILAQFPKQVHILKPITTVSGLKGKKKALKKRVTSGGGTRSFRKWCATRAGAAAGDARFAEKIIKCGEQATLQLADMLADMVGFADNIRDATPSFTDEELGILRRQEPVTDDIVVKILDGTMRLAMKFFLLHPNGKIPPAAHDLPYSFIFRFALCAFLHALHWRVPGGAEDRLAERMRNDVIDVTYAAYGLCFDGLLSEDKLVCEIYGNAEVMLTLFTKHAPKPPHRHSNTGGVNAGPVTLEPSSSR